MDLPVRIYTPESPIRHPGRLVAAMWQDLLASRELAWRLFVRDLSAMYRQSFFGYLWAFMPPILAAAPWVFLNSQKIVNVRETGIPYAAFVLTGTMLWQSFMDALNAPLKQTSGAKSMLSKINFPKEALLLAGLADTLWNVLIRMVVLVPVFIVYQVPVSGSLLWAPLGVLSLVLFGMALGLVITPVGLLYTDVGRGIQIVGGVGMLLTPVVYPPAQSGLGGWLAAWNPLSPVLVTARDWLTSQPTLLLDGFWWVTAGAFVLFIVSWFFYRLTLPILVERMGG